MATSILIAFLVVSVTLLGSSCSVKADNILYPGESLATGSFLNLGSYVLIMRRDCNLVLYEVDTPVWHSNTGSFVMDCYCTITKVGNLVIFTPAEKAIWTSNTARSQGNYVLVLQSDRNVVIYGPGVWAAGSHVRAAADSTNTTRSTTYTTTNHAVA